MSALPLVFWLALVLPGVAIARRWAPKELEGGLLAGAGFAWMASFAALAPFVALCYLVGAPLWVLSGAIVAFVGWGAVDLVRARAWRGLPAAALPLVTLAGAIVVADAWLSARTGAILDNDSRVHIARIRFLFEHGLSNADPFVRSPRESAYPIYHTNLLHALCASGSALLGIDPVTMWFNTLSASKVLIATGMAYLAWAVLGGAWAPWIAAAMVIVNRGPYTFSLYPNQLAPWAAMPVALGVLYRTLRGCFADAPPGAWRAALLAGGPAAVVGMLHPLYAGFLVVVALPVAGAVALERVLRRKPGARAAVVASLALAVVALAFPLASRAMTAQGIDRHITKALESSPEQVAARRARMRGGEVDPAESGLGAAGRDLLASERAPDPDAAAAAAAGPADDAAGNEEGAEANTSTAPQPAADKPARRRPASLVRPMDGFIFHERGDDDWISRAPMRGFLGGQWGIPWWRVWFVVAAVAIAVWRLRRPEALLLAGSIVVIEAILLVPPLCTTALRFLGANWMLGRFETVAFVLWIPLSLPALAALVESMRAWRRLPALVVQSAICAVAIPIAMAHSSHRAPYTWERYHDLAMQSEGRRVGRQHAGLMKQQAWMREAIPPGAVVLTGTLTGTWVTMLHDASGVASERSSTGIRSGKLRRTHVDEMFSPDTDEGRRADLFHYYGVTHVMVAGRTPVWAKYWTVGGNRAHGHALLTLRPLPDESLLWLRDVMVASAQLDRGNAAGALERVRPVVAAHPESPEAWFTYGNALTALGTDAPEAEAAYRRAVELDPAEPLHLIMLGNAIAAQARHEEAAEVFERAVDLALRQTNLFAAAGAAFNRGNSLYALDRLPEALSSYERALEFDPRHAKAQRARGWLREDLGLDPPSLAVPPETVQPPAEVGAEGEAPSAPSTSPRP
jgi:Flp pilus assembly protein TadD